MALLLLLLARDRRRLDGRRHVTSGIVAFVLHTAALVQV